MFYERYLDLCRQRHIPPSSAATAAGFNKGTVTSWKKKYEAGIDVDPNQDVVTKICNYFGCTEKWLRGLNQEDNKKSPPANSREARKQEFIQILDSMTEAEQEALLLGMKARYVNEE